MRGRGGEKGKWKFSFSPVSLLYKNQSKLASSSSSFSPRLSKTWRNRQESFVRQGIRSKIQQPSHLQVQLKLSPTSHWSFSYKWVGESPTTIFSASSKPSSYSLYAVELATRKQRSRKIPHASISYPTFNPTLTTIIFTLGTARKRCNTRTNPVFPRNFSVPVQNFHSWFNLLR